MMKKETILRGLGFQTNQHSIKTEMLAGITTFLAMSYILAVNPAIFEPLAQQGMSSGAVFTATALASAIGTLFMALIARLPFGLAPGMGLNAFFVYTICLGMGYPWQFALTAVLLEGIIFLLLTITGFRSMIVEALPKTLRNAIGPGIGLFIALIGLQNAGIIVSSPNTLVTLGDITHGPALLSIIGMLICTVLLILKVRGALLIGIMATSLIGIPMGISEWKGVFSAPESVLPIFCQFQWHDILSTDMLIVMLTMLFMDIFDTMGSLIGICSGSGMTDKDGKIPNLNRAFLSDSMATIAGACLGTNTTTTFVESSTGVAQGGRTGLTALVVSALFFIALFFSPLFLSIPAAATAPVLVVVGIMMMRSIKDIDLTDFSEAIPAFITIIMIPFSYSISDGILLGMISYTIAHVAIGKFRTPSVVMYVLTILGILKFIFL